MIGDPNRAELVREALEDVAVVRQAVHSIGTGRHPVDPELQHAASPRRRGVTQSVVARMRYDPATMRSPRLLRIPIGL
jgi:hypothetical protein